MDLPRARSSRDANDPAVHVERTPGPKRSVLAEDLNQDTRPDVLAYPYGHADERVAAEARRSYAFACTDEFRSVRPTEDPWRVPRLDAYYFQRAGVLDGWGSRRFAGYLGLRLLGRRARRFLEGAGLLGK